jgi:hypothetical protein
MNFSQKIVLAALAVSLIAVSFCTRRNTQAEQNEELGETHRLHYGQGPAGGNHYGQGNRTFEIYIYSDSGGKCYADLNVVTLWKKNNNNQTVHQNVKWFSDDGKEYTVDFRPDPNYSAKHGSPFNSANAWFTVPQGKSVPSGDLKADSSGYYAYAIVPGHDLSAKPCRDASDPGVHVNP